MSQNEKNLEERINKCREQGIPESTIQFAVKNLDLLADLTDDKFEKKESEDTTN